MRNLADHISFNDDSTAWIVTAEGQRPNVWSSAAYWSDLDRPCDTCDGEGVEFAGDEDDIGDACSANCIDGRHTFEIEVPHPDGPCDHIRLSCEDIGCEGPTTTFRVSVITGMVLPIVSNMEWDGKTLPVICKATNDGDFFMRSSDDHGIIRAANHITLPPAAEPGMWAVKLKVQQ